MRVRYSDEFKKSYSKIKDDALRRRIHKAIQKLPSMPLSGKPLKYGYKGYRRLRVGPFRIFYRIEKEVIMIAGFEHRKKVYR
jgi:mRNA interferase RelE/StbE